MRVFLDTNIWSYFADHDAGSDLAKTARASKVQIVVSPAVVEEVQGLPVLGARSRVIKLVTDPQWKRLMPEAFSECAEVKAEIKRLRPDWVIANPDTREINRLRYDWVKRTSGYWDRARNAVTLPATNESVRGEREAQLAVQEAFEIRERMKKVKKGSESHLQNVAGLPKQGTAGWNGLPVDYWRLSSLMFFSKELQVFASPIREWLDSEINVFAMAFNSESMNRLWLHDFDPAAVPRQWLRGAFEFLQAWHKVTTGTPGDSRLATHLVDAEMIVSADKNFVRFAERCRAEAPFAVGETLRAPANREGVDEVLKLIAAIPSRGRD